MHDDHEKDGRVIGEQGNDAKGCKYLPLTYNQQWSASAGCSFYPPSHHHSFSSRIPKLPRTFGSSRIMTRRSMKNSTRTHTSICPFTILKRANGSVLADSPGKSIIEKKSVNFIRRTSGWVEFSVWFIRYYFIIILTFINQQAWLGDLNDGIHDGGPNDPRLSLIFVEAQTVHYSLQDVPTAVKYFNIVRGMVTAEPPKISAERGLSKQELDVARRAGKVEE